MFSLEREIARLLPADKAAPLIAKERREVVSIYTEVRVLAWVGVMLLMTGVGIIVSKNIDRIGPITIAVSIGIASAACYTYSVWRRASAGRMLDDFILLLGALLLSADVGYIEHQFHLLGADWPRHFLLLAAVHGATAYVFSSRALLSLSIAALMSWLGIENRAEMLFTESTEMALRAFTGAGVVAVWRVVNRRRELDIVFDHYIANLGFWGSLILTFSKDTRILGVLIAIVLSALTIAYGFRKRKEPFVIYAYIYGVVAVDILITEVVSIDLFVFFFMIVSTIAAIVGLFLLHARFRKAAA